MDSRPTVTLSTGRHASCRHVGRVSTAVGMQIQCQCAAPVMPQMDPEAWRGVPSLDRSCRSAANGPFVDVAGARCLKAGGEPLASEHLR